MEVRFSTFALQEVTEAARYYEAEVEGLGKAFLEKIREGTAEIEDQQIFIAAVMHLKRKPNYWER